MKNLEKKQENRHVELNFPETREQTEKNAAENEFDVAWCVKKWSLINENVCQIRLGVLETGILACMRSFFEHFQRLQ
jgi:hypothetical protein